MANRIADTDQAFNEGSQAARTGRSRFSNPYRSRCPKNHNGRHRRSLAGRCYMCGDWPSKRRSQLRDAWDQGWRTAATEPKQLRLQDAA